MAYSDSSELVHCPYNPAHTSSRARLARHLHRCRRNFPEVLEICRFNAIHHVRKEEMEMHLQICQQRAEMEARHIEGHMQRNEGHTLNLPRPSTPPVIEMDEDWDAEVAQANMKAYNPSLAAMKKQVIRGPPDATPSQRKLFRAEEKDRLNALKEKELEAKTGGSCKPVIPGLNYKDRDDDDFERSSQKPRVSKAVAGGTRKVFKHFSEQD